ncbi:MarR family winged helix-turn-helix transcriptional regulator [Paeniglutamicibacter sulfureus]|uniref:DNA-binding MarR family transcriptional regulator n=1 Tax=Paeniglutamicibacter sulfureus TaxID=43666 RepID=A0ABU2BK96_9MICC|nr:MarR family transcriptional regulator [Paeniglutamicibacter sulfureus]MDO2934778.1 MarR family transcriptional regulator [Paeniglutamicibacter sulfureus]MDR7359052.1 DNA-binding MarR family transcriptional regulator [Paeniglutamicibacter sulfureus]
MIKVSTGETSGPHAASKLLHEVLMLNDVLEHAVCRHLGINETDFQALQHLMLDRPMTPGELAGKLNISSAATTALIDRMSDRGYVSRAAHPTDRRSIRVHPSTRAVNLTMTALRPLFNDAELGIQELDPDEQRAVVRYLEGILTAMHTQIDTLAPPATTQKRNERS